MKTKEQILGWLDKQPWKNEFYENSFKQGLKHTSYDGDFIITAFDYELTAQGNEVWGRRSAEYANWYNSNDRPMSWEEYLKKSRPIQDASIKINAYIGNNSEFLQCGMSKELCEAFIAYMKLIQLRNAWVKDCKRMPLRFKIMSQGGKVMVSDMILNSCGLSFEYMTTAEEFINVFKDLLETAKPLL